MRRLQYDEGAAMIMVLSVILICTTLGVAGAAVALNSGKASNGQRAGVSAVAAAEAGVDVTYQLLKTGQPSAGCTQVAGESVWRLPATDLPGGKPVSAGYAGTVVFFDSMGKTGTAAACSAPARAVVTSVGTYQGRTGLNPAASRRGMESLVDLAPITSGGLGAAIFSAQGMTEGNNFNLYSSGSSINDANVYIANGNFSCSNNQPLASGSLTIARGSLITTGGCKPKIYGDLLVKANIQSVGGLEVTGNAAAGGSVAGCSASIGRRLTITSGAPPSSCAAAQGFGVAPVTVPTFDFPSIDYVEADWVAAGYVPVPLPTGCPTAAQISSRTTATVYEALSCDFDPSDFSLSAKVAIFARSVSMNADVTASAAQNLHLIVPTSAVVGACPVSDDNPKKPPAGYDARFSGSNISSAVSLFVYTPCKVKFSQQQNLYGQVYGGNVSSANQLNLTFRSPGVPGVPLLGGAPQATGTFNVNVVYKREISGAQ